MRRIGIIVALIISLSCFGANRNNGVSTYTITAGGATVTFDPTNVTPPQLPGLIYVTTNGAVNLGGNSYILTLASTPAIQTSWQVQFDASQLTAVAANVILFGETPLVKYPGVTQFVINYDVHNNATGTPTVYPNYAAGPLLFPPSLTVIGTAKFYGTVKIPGLGTPSPTNNALLLANDSSVTQGCPACAWDITGNTGTTPGTNFLGTTDAEDLEFKIYGIKAGLIDSANSNTAFGLEAGLYYTGSNNTAVGARALRQNVQTGSTSIGASSLTQSITGSNTGVGYFSGYNTTGSHNTFIGEGSGYSCTSGSTNIGLGYYALGTTLTTGSNNIAIGGDVASASTTYGIALGFNAAAGNNQIAFSDHETALYMKLNNGAAGTILTNDGSGNASWQAPAAQILTAKVTISSANILTSNGSPVTIISAPGSGNIITILSAFATTAFNTSAYTTHTTLALQYHSGGSTNGIATNANALAATATQSSPFLTVAASGTGVTQIVSNADVELLTIGGNPAAGDSPITIYVTYTITPQ